MNVLSLFSGLGGWEDAWPLSWDVISVDINAELSQHRENAYSLPPLSLVIDLTWPDAIDEIVGVMERRGWEHVDMIVASPPCYEFYKAAFPARLNAVDGDTDTSMSEACLDSTYRIIRFFAPRYWIVENTEKGSPWVSEVFGPVRQQLGAYYLWHNMPLLSAEVPHKIKGKPDPRHSPIRSNIRARIPLGLSKAVVVAALEQQTLFTVPLCHRLPPL